jgi:hypothetical protein
MIYSSFPYVLWPRPKDYGVVIPNASGMLQNAKALLEMGEKSWKIPWKSPWKSLKSLQSYMKCSKRNAGRISTVRRLDAWPEPPAGPHFNIFQQPTSGDVAAQNKEDGFKYFKMFGVFDISQYGSNSTQGPSTAWENLVICSYDSAWTQQSVTSQLHFLVDRLMTFCWPAGMLSLGEFCHPCLRIRARKHLVARLEVSSLNSWFQLVSKGSKQSV